MGQKSRTRPCCLTTLVLLIIAGATLYIFASYAISYCNNPNNFQDRDTKNGPLILEIRQKYNRVFEAELRALLTKQKSGTASRQDYKEMMDRAIFEVPKDQFGWSWRLSYRPNGQAYCSDLVGFVWEELPKPSKNLNKRHELEHLLQCLDQDRSYFMDSAEWDANLPAFKEYPLGILSEMWVTISHKNRRCRPWTVEIPEMTEYLKDICNPGWIAACLLVPGAIFAILRKARQTNHARQEES